MIAILLGFTVISILLFVFYVTGKILLSDDEYPLIRGFTIWMVISIIILVCLIVGKVILHFF